MSTSPSNTTSSGARDFSDFDSGVLEFAGKLRAFVRRRISRPEDAEDLSQEVILKVFRSRASLRDPEKLEAWLYQVARGAIVDYYRRKRPSETVPEDLVAEEHGFDEVGRILARSARRFLQTLPDNYRVPLELAELEGLSIAEISSRLKLGPSAVKSRLQRGRALLRDKMITCCQFEYDPKGRVIDFKRKGPCACNAEPGGHAQSARRARGSPLLPAYHMDLAKEADAPAILALLRENQLPTQDLNPERLLNFVTAYAGPDLLACAGIEPYGSAGLLRSVAVRAAFQNAGLGSQIVARAELLATQLGLESLYLLTTTAPDFFAARAYERIERREAPAELRESSEFRSVCPASAILMHKLLCCTGV